MQMRLPYGTRAGWSVAEREAAGVPRGAPWSRWWSRDSPAAPLGGWRCPQATQATGRSFGHPRPGAAIPSPPGAARRVAGTGVCAGCARRRRVTSPLSLSPSRQGELRKLNPCSSIPRTPLHPWASVWVSLCTSRCYLGLSDGGLGRPPPALGAGCSQRAQIPPCSAAEETAPLNCLPNMPGPNPCPGRA